MLEIIIVNWNAGTQLKTCVDSITDFGGDYVDKVVVVDNGSIDGSESFIEHEPKVELIRAGENLGFGKACNLGAQDSESEYLLFLNPDAALYEDTLSKAIKYMSDPANQRVGICGVQLIDESGNISRSCARFPSPSGLIAHAVGADRLVKSLGHFMAEWDHVDNRQVDHVIGAFFLVRHSIFKQLNGFDERFFVYLEDLDFSYRAKQAGWFSYFLADAQAFHAGGGTSKQIKARRLFYSLRSRLLYSFKHFSRFKASLVLLFTLLVEPLARSFFTVARRSWLGLKQTWEGYFMLWKWLPKWFFKNETR